MNCIEVNLSTETFQEVDIVLGEFVCHSSKLGQLHGQNTRMRQEIQYGLRFCYVSKQHVVKANY